MHIRSPHNAPSLSYQLLNVPSWWKVLVDRALLKWWLQFKNAEVQIPRWLERWQEFDLDIMIEEIIQNILGELVFQAVSIVKSKVKKNIPVQRTTVENSCIYFDKRIRRRLHAQHGEVLDTWKWGAGGQVFRYSLHFKAYWGNVREIIVFVDDIDRLLVSGSYWQVYLLGRDLEMIQLN